MSKILVIPDVHLKAWMFDKVEEVLKSVEVDNIVCLGDLVDDWYAEYSFELYEETLSRVIDFDKSHSDMLWCYGNHDVSYLWGKKESGYLDKAKDIVCEYLDKLKEQAGNRLKFLHLIDTTLFSHAGVVQGFIEQYVNTTVLTEDVVNKINQFGVEEMWKDNSPIWARPQDFPFYDVITTDFWQVVGHTPVEKASLTNYEKFLTLDTFSTYSNGYSIGDEKFVIVDTISHTSEVVNDS